MRQAAGGARCAAMLSRERSEQPVRDELGLLVDDEVGRVGDELELDRVALRCGVLDRARRDHDVALPEDEPRGHAQVGRRVAAAQQARHLA